jgi:hypothetical protein
MSKVSRRRMAPLHDLGKHSETEGSTTEALRGRCGMIDQTLRSLRELRDCCVTRSLCVLSILHGR